MGNYINALYILCIGLTLALGFFSLKKNYKSAIHQTFSLFTLFTAFWMVALYFGFYYLKPGYEPISVNLYRWCFGFGAVFVFFLTRFIYLFPKKTYCFPKWAEYSFTAFSFVIFVLSSFTPYIYENEIILIEQKMVEDKLGVLYVLFMIFLFGNYFLEIYLATKKIKHSKGVEGRKMMFAFWGLFVFLFCAAMTNAILPIFKIIVFQRESVLFSLLFIIPAYYAIVRYRFLDIKLVISKTLKNIASFVLAAAVAYAPYYILESFFLKEIDDFLRKITIVTCIGIAFLLYSKIQKFFYSPAFYRFVGYTESELFVKTITDFKNNSIVYRTLEELETDLRETFCDKLHIDSATIVFPDSEKRGISPLVEYFQNQTKLLAAQEIEFLQKEGGVIPPSSTELASFGEICVPLFHTSGKLIGFFVLGKKQFRDVYYKEELDALDDFSRYLSSTLTGIMYNYSIRQEVSEKTQDLQKMVQHQSDFITVTAHELRTPLSIVRFGYEELMERLKDDPEMKDDAETVQEGIERISQISENILDVQEYDSGRKLLNMSEVNGFDFFHDMHKLFKPLMKEKSIHFKLENHLPKNFRIKMDTEKIQKVIENFLTNAIRYTPEKGEIILRAQEENISILFSVIDEGEGVPKDQKKEIFKKFKGNDVLQAPGIGLGLYICQKIIELHEGDIWVENSQEKQKGAEFNVRLAK